MLGGGLLGTRRRGVLAQELGVFLHRLAQDLALAHDDGLSPLDGDLARGGHRLEVLAVGGSDLVEVDAGHLELGHELAEIELAKGIERLGHGTSSWSYIAMQHERQYSPSRLWRQVLFAVQHNEIPAGPGRKKVILLRELPAGHVTPPRPPRKCCAVLCGPSAGRALPSLPHGADACRGRPWCGSYRPCRRRANCAGSRDRPRRDPWRAPGREARSSRGRRPRASSSSSA